MRIRLYVAVAIAFGLICFVAYGGIAWATGLIYLLVTGYWLAAFVVAVTGLTVLAIAWQAVGGIITWGER